MHHVHDQQHTKNPSNSPATPTNYIKPDVTYLDFMHIHSGRNNTHETDGGSFFAS